MNQEKELEDISNKEAILLFLWCMVPLIMIIWFRNKHRLNFAVYYKTKSGFEYHTHHNQVVFVYFFTLWMLFSFLIVILSELSQLIIKETGIYDKILERKVKR